MCINTGKTSARLTDALSATMRGFKSCSVGLWKVFLYAYTNFTVVNCIDNEASNKTNQLTTPASFLVRRKYTR